MKYLVKIFIIAFLSIIIISCKQERNKSHKNVQAESTEIKFQGDSSLEKAIVHSAVTCSKDTSLTYAVFLPSEYSLKKKFPIIYFFDSHADGSLPLEKYKSLAEEYNFILVASNNSKNGLSPEVSARIIHSFFEDTYSRFSIDKNRIYTAGFSGGARVASSIALGLVQPVPAVKGVIACGAGFPGLGNQKIKANFNFVGIVGSGDFNLVEMKNLERALASGSSMIHQLLVFDGKHEWPPEEIMEEAFLLLEIAAMKNGDPMRNDSLIGQYIQVQENKILSFKKADMIVELWSLYRSLSENLFGLYDITKYNESMLSLEQSPQFIEALKKEIDEEQKEIEMQKIYTGFLVSKNTGWWEKQISSLKKSKDPKSKRLLGYMGLAAYMHSANALKNEMLDRADNFLKIYALLEPENSEHQYLRAQYWMKLNQPEKAITSLHAALDLGFNDLSRLSGDSLFFPLKAFPQFITIEQKLAG